MSDTNQNKNNSEEVDLAGLFKMIGNGFGMFFNFIWRVLKVLFDLLIRFILFVRRHFVKFAIAAAVGAVAGYILEDRQEVIYGADLVVKPNFDSARQLYNTIQYYNNLVDEKDTLLLAEAFNISTAEAASLRSFSIRPEKNENSTLEVYTRFLENALDSTDVGKYSYENFKRHISNYDYDVHRIQVTSLKNDVFKNLQAVIIASIKENSYFNAKMQIALENLDRSDSILNNSLAEIDSLRNIYMDVLLAEAEKQNPQGGTSVVLSESKAETKELELFNVKIRFKNELNNNGILRSENSEVINIISSFQPVGYRVSVLYKKYYFVFAIGGIALMLLYLLIIELNGFLNTYEKRSEDKSEA